MNLRKIMKTITEYDFSSKIMKNGVDRRLLRRAPELVVVLGVTVQDAVAGGSFHGTAAPGARLTSASWWERDTRQCLPVLPGA